MAEFGVYTFSGQAPPTPKNEPKVPKPPKTPKAKRRQEREEAEATKAKARRDSEPTPEPGTTEDKENAQVIFLPPSSFQLKRSLTSVSLSRVG